MLVCEFRAQRVRLLRRTIGPVVASSSSRSAANLLQLAVLESATRRTADAACSVAPDVGSLASKLRSTRGGPESPRAVPCSCAHESALLAKSSGSQKPPGREAGSDNTSAAWKTMDQKDLLGTPLRGPLLIRCMQVLKPCIRGLYVQVGAHSNRMDRSCRVRT